MKLLNNKTCGYLVINRDKLYKTVSLYTKTHLMHPKFNIVDYKGIEGEHWPENTYEFLSNQFEDVYDYYRDIKVKYPSSKFDLLFISNEFKEGLLIFNQDNFRFCGYDFSIYTSKWNVFSVIVNEILFGNYNEIKDFNKYLNEHLLFSSVDDIEKINEARAKLLMSGADLETSEGKTETPQLFAVFEFIGRN